jgi:hypothetical protein
MPLLRTVVLATLAPLLATALVALAPPPATAATRTFEPDGPRRYLDSVTVTSSERGWRFEVRTRNAERVIGIELFIDIGRQGPGADYIVQNVLGTNRLYRSTDGTRAESTPANCRGKRAGVLRGSAGPGRFVTIPQSCLVPFGTDAPTPRPVGRLRVRAAAIGQPPRGNCVYSWSPRRGRDVFHGWVRNVDTGAYPARAVERRRPARPAEAPARRGC